MRVTQKVNGVAPTCLAVEMGLETNKLEDQTLLVSFKDAAKITRGLTYLSHVTRHTKSGTLSPFYFTRVLDAARSGKEPVREFGIQIPNKGEGDY